VRNAGTRLLRILLVGGLALGGHRLLEPSGHAWVLLPVAGAVTSVVFAVEVWRWRRRRAAAALAREVEDAMLDGGVRPRVIARLWVEVERARKPREQARTRIALAELLDADGQLDAAVEVLARLDLSGLPAFEAAAVRHARAQVALRRDDPEAALAALDGRPVSCGDAELDARLELLEAMARVERGEVDAALRVAALAERRAGEDEDLVREARLVRACALDARGETAEADALVAELDRDVRVLLADLGTPRVRRMIARQSGSVP
jgi:hypothetical protein